MSNCLMKYDWMPGTGRKRWIQGESSGYGNRIHKFLQFSIYCLTTTAALLLPIMKDTSSTKWSTINNLWPIRLHLVVFFLLKRRGRDDRREKWEKETVKVGKKGNEGKLINEAVVKHVRRKEQVEGSFRRILFFYLLSPHFLLLSIPFLLFLFRVNEGKKAFRRRKCTFHTLQATQQHLSVYK